MKKIIGLILLLTHIAAFSQNKAYNIKLQLDGFTDSVYYLVSYYADKFQSVDTAYLNDHSVIFEGDKTLEPGIYILAGEKMNKYFEFLIDNEQEFSISASKNKLIESITAADSEENHRFFEYLKFNKAKFDKLNQLQQELKNLKSESSKDSINNEIEDIKIEVDKFKLNFIEEHPDALLAKIFLGMQEPEIDKNEPMEISYQHYKQSYWDFIDLGDPRMLRTPILHNKLSNYFDKIIIQHPDTLIQNIDKLLDRPMHQEIKNHFIWHLTLKYEYPDIMGLDQVFVHMVDRYFRTGTITGISNNIMENIEKRANKISKVLIGKPAPDLVMLDTSSNAQSLYHIEANYILILFWDQECQVCQKEIKELKQLLNKDTFGIKVFAVGTDADEEGWKAYIRKNQLNWINVNGNKSFSNDYHELYDIFSTPTIYLLNQKKEIIAKRLSVGQIQGFIENYQSRPYF